MVPGVDTPLVQEDRRMTMQALPVLRDTWRPKRRCLEC